MTSDRQESPGAEVWLRPFAEEHLDRTYEWLQDPDLRRDFMLPRPINQAGHAKWFKRLAKDDSQAVFAIEARGLGHVGNAGVKNLERGTGELWIYLKPGTVRGKGLGTLAARELIRILFQEMNLEAIFLHVAETNRAALGLYEKLGFVRSKKPPSSEWGGHKGRVVRMRLARPDAYKPKAALLACYDSGGANALAILARELPRAGYPLLSLAAGPARTAFRNQKVAPWRESSRDITLQEAELILDETGPGLVILGTSLKAWTERNFCRAADSKGIPAVSFVDFWSNHGRRFSTPGTMDLAYLPSRVAVLDETSATACAADGIPRERLLITGNPYWDHLCSLKQGQRERIRKAVRTALGLEAEDLAVLIISSNLRNLEFDLGYTDRDLFEAIFPMLDWQAGPGRVCFLIKPHPEEPRAELMDLVKGRGLVLEPEAAPLETVLASDLVIGSVSSLVFETALLGRPVISLQPVGFSGPKQILRLFSRMGIPEIGSPAAAKKHLLEFIKNRSRLASRPGPAGEAWSGRAVQEFLKAIREVGNSHKYRQAAK